MQITLWHKCCLMANVWGCGLSCQHLLSCCEKADVTDSLSWHFDLTESEEIPNRVTVVVCFSGDLHHPKPSPLSRMGMSNLGIQVPWRKRRSRIFCKAETFTGVLVWTLHVFLWTFCITMKHNVMALKWRSEHNHQPKAFGSGKMFETDPPLGAKDGETAKAPCPAFTIAHRTFRTTLQSRQTDISRMRGKSLVPLWKASRPFRTACLTRIGRCTVRREAQWWTWWTTGPERWGETELKFVSKS